MASFIEPHQYTLKRTVSCCGVGLHTGRTVNLTLKPAAANSGIRFLRSDIEGKPHIPARVENVVDTTLATTIGDGDARISTTEHLMAALRGYGIDNVEVDIDSHEVPIMDGSAKPFMHLLKRSGKVKQRALRKILRITKPIEYTEGDKTIRIEPYDGFKVTGRIHFDNELINEQTYSLDVNQDRFAKEIASARTFGFVEQVEYLWQNGLALGGNLDNTIAIHWDRRSILNEDGLRFDDEFIRHKVLDLIGDLALLGAPVLGHVTADRSGHGVHLALMQTIAQHPDCWEYVKFEKKGDMLLRKVVTTTKSARGRLSPLFVPGTETSSRQPVCLA
ncbi:MAG: UDP-3-O-[3-hydroxymyristoyl] N-acetylglucosamine deacetylase [Desulfobulbus propionicus]|nr:MAG: UDP-3-O-[3-hydroxymyristoyl] N-acetylglucosamine deacetylase [Desulfobulbus propionicus]PIE60808.1 MAG: UDP-3-O-[3-hydroxymyristoyl] N-acetylglucosamine deacetylase [Desulfobulbus propionicus]